MGDAKRRKVKDKNYGRKRRISKSSLQKFLFQLEVTENSIGEKVLNCPLMGDVLYLTNKRATFCTPANYFEKSYELLMDSTKPEDFLTKFAAGTVQEGYYIINYLNRRSRYIGQSWYEALVNIAGKYLALNPYEAITDTAEEYTYENFRGTVLLRHFSQFFTEYL